MTAFAEDLAELLAQNKFLASYTLSGEAIYKLMPVELDELFTGPSALPSRALCKQALDRIAATYKIEKGRAGATGRGGACCR